MSFFPKLRHLLILLALVPAFAPAQTIFTYGRHAVSRAEFLEAYNKNNSDSSNPRMSYGEYLDLYARFRLKVQAAKDEGLDTTAQQRAELQAFRNQLSEAYLKDEASIAMLVEEAARRSRHDIHLTGIYVPLAPGPTQDEIETAHRSALDAYAQLQHGASFEDVARKFRYEDFGYITALVLPYDIENIAYNTPVGRYAQPVRTESGFHILRPVDSRDAVGRIRVAQILIAFPPNADQYAKTRTAARADSVYRALQAGARFSTLALQLSDDNFSFQTGGELPAFGVGQYDTAFEAAAFALAADSAISRPVKTSFGYHILQRLERIPVPAEASNKSWNASLKALVQQSDRMKVAQQVFARNVKKIISKDLPGAAGMSDILALVWYRDHLEKYTPEFASQLREFSEGNLLFAVMQKNIWAKSTADTAALLKYYESNRSKYLWGESADALIFTCLQKDQVEGVRALVKQNLPEWRNWAAASQNYLQIDSGRYELGMIPTLERTNFTEGLLTAPVPTGQDSSAVFAYIIRVHRNQDQKSFDDARGAVINDYQTLLENQWLDSLRKKYPVKVNRKVVDRLPPVTPTP